MVVYTLHDSQQACKHAIMWWNWTCFVLILAALIQSPTMALHGILIEISRRLNQKIQIIIYDDNKNIQDYHGVLESIKCNSPNMMDDQQGRGHQYLSLLISGPSSAEIMQVVGMPWGTSIVTAWHLAALSGLTLKRLGHFFQNVILFSNVVHYKWNFFLYETGPIQWVFNQHCGCWWPGALAPGHQ